MKKICIVTVYNSINSGSYWQAFVLGKFLEENGCSVSYLKREGNGDSSNKFFNMLKLAVRIGVKHGFGHGWRIWKQYFEFKKREKDFPIISAEETGEIDCFVLGSDTIWNLDSTYFVNNRGRYWGTDFGSTKVISYAASVANTNVDTIKKYPELLDALSNMHAISLRDIHTKNVISEITSAKVTMVCDPTLLWRADNYKKYISENTEPKYIFLYLFKPLEDEKMNLLRKFAKSNNLIIISGAGVNKNCDKYIINSPREFLKYMYFAEYIVTDTFHGTVFSVNFEKKFVVIKRSKNKVDEFLAECNLSDRLSDGMDMQEVFQKTIDYKNINEVLDVKRTQSQAFLRNNI